MSESGALPPGESPGPLRPGEEEEDATTSGLLSESAVAAVRQSVLRAMAAVRDQEPSPLGQPGGLSSHSVDSVGFAESASAAGEASSSRPGRVEAEKEDPFDSTSRMSRDLEPSLSARASDLAPSLSSRGSDLDPAPSSLRRRRAADAAAVQARLTSEVLRKVRLATQAEQKEDRDIICSEVFADITGDLSGAARESTGSLYVRWYEVLAPHFCRDHAASEQLLGLCRLLWGQPFTAPTYALLLHQWLLVHPQAGGSAQRLKYLNVMVAGARQLFIGDVETGNRAFQPLYAFVAEQVVLSRDGTRLHNLPSPAREVVMGVVAAFLPYYTHSRDFIASLAAFPAPRRSAAATGAAASREADAPLDLGAQRPPGADFAVDRLCDALSRDVRTEAGLAAYLAALQALQGTPVLAALQINTRVRLQGELYALTQSGGPRYASRRVNRLAFEALDALFPRGALVRRAVATAFRALHPQDWPRALGEVCAEARAAARGWASGAWAQAAGVVRGVLGALEDLRDGVLGAVRDAKEGLERALPESLRRLISEPRRRAAS